MADALTGLNDFLGGLNLNFANPIGLAISIILSTIVGGIVILVIVEVFAKKFSEEVKPTHAFLVALVSSLINLFGIVSLLGQFILMVPALGILILILPIIVWIVLIKVFFSGLSILHALIIGAVCWFLSGNIIPILVGLVSGFIPGL
jgi:hypothetical protein